MAKAIQLPSIVCVKWGDAFIETEDFKAKDAQDTKPVIRNTVGFLIAKNQHGYVLATDTFDDSDECSAKMFIPHGMVIKVHRIKNPLTRVRSK
jgi:hypothetical protein